MLGSCYTYWSSCAINPDVRPKAMRRFRFTLAGFTLVEVMVALGIFGIVIAQIVPSFAAHMRYNSIGERRTQAMAAAQHLLDHVRFMDPQTLPSSGTTTSPVTIDSRVYSVVTTYCERAEFCMSPASRHLKVTVNYQGQVQYETETVYTRMQ